MESFAKEIIEKAMAAKGVEAELASGLYKVARDRVDRAANERYGLAPNAVNLAALGLAGAGVGAGLGGLVAPRDENGISDSLIQAALLGGGAALGTGAIALNRMRRATAQSTMDAMRNDALMQAKELFDEGVNPLEAAKLFKERIDASDVLERTQNPLIESLSSLFRKAEEAEPFVLLPPMPPQG